MMELLPKSKKYNLYNIFYECGSGGEFLVFLLGMHHQISSRNFRVDDNNKWIIVDGFQKMAGRGLESRFDNWEFTNEHVNYIARDHANLLYPTENWKDNLNRTLEDGIKDFNDLYVHRWGESKTIWLNIDNIADLKFIDELSAFKNFPGNHKHYTKVEYEKRFTDVKSRLAIKRQRFLGNYITINIRNLWLDKTKNELEKIINFLEIDNCYLDLWQHMISYWNHKNSELLRISKRKCNTEYCVPIEL